MPHLMFAAPAVALLRDVFWKSLPVFAVAGLAWLLLRRSSAAARHALWLLTLAGLLCLPVFCALLPQWAAPVLPAAPRPQVAAPRQAPDVVVTPPQAATVAPGVPAPQASPAPGASHAPAMPDAALPSMPAVPVPPTYSVIPSQPTLSDWVCLAWLVGALLVLGRTLLGLAAASRLVRRCRLITAGPLEESASDARQALGLTRPLSLRVGPVAVPMTCGVARPVVLLPEGAEDWPAERLRAVLLHEAAHVKRLDWATMLLARCVCAAYWAHPLVWLAAVRLRAEAEGACDDLVLTCGIPAPDYAAHLLEIVRGLASRRAALPSMVAMAHRPEVAGRLRTILDGHTPRQGVTRRSLVMAAVAAVALLAPLAALHPVASSPARSKQHTHIPMDAAVSPALAAMMAGRSRWEVRLPNGVRVRLLSVSESPAGATLASTWKPDGTPELSTQRAWPMPSNSGARACQFFWGIVFPTDKQMSGVSIFYGKVGEQEGTGGSESPEILGRATTGSFGEWFPVAQQQAALQVSIATGPKETLIDAPANTGAVRHLPTGEIISVSPLRHRAADVAHEGGRLIDTRTVFVTVPARFVHNMSEYELQTIGAEGKPFTPAHSGGSFPQVTGKTAHLLYTYRTSELLLNRIKGFRFTYRPSYTAVFRDVALRPAGTPLPFLPSPQKEKAKAGQLASEANLRQIGLGIEQYIENHHERYPDAAHWMDEIIPYLVPAQVTGAARQQRIAALFHDPSAPAGQMWSYAYNRALSGLSLAKDDSPALTVAVFESTQGVRNANDGGQSVPSPGWHSGGSDFLFADTHVKWVRTSVTWPLFNPSSAANAAAMPTPASQTPGPRIDHVAAIVDLTHRSGAMVQRTGDGVNLTFFGNKQFIWMPIDTRSLMVTSLHVNSWRIHDSAGNSLALTDNARQPVIVINRTENPLTLVGRAGSPAIPITLPPNSMMFLNHVLSPLTVSGASHGVSYRVSIPKTKFPLTIIRSLQPQMSMEGIPDYPVNTNLN